MIRRSRNLSTLVSASCCALAFAACATTVKTSARDAANAEQSSSQRARELPAREDLPFEAREMLSARMVRHGEDMTALMIHVLVLDYDVAGILASSLAREPKLGRPTANETGTLNALLPTSFFHHQDALSASASELAEAAAARDDRRLVDAFDAVAKSCVGCHSTYLHGTLAPLEHDEPGTSVDCGYSDSCEQGDDAAD